MANKLKNKMILELDAEEHGFEKKNAEKQKGNVLEYINELAQKSKDEGKTSTYYLYRGIAKQLIECKGNKITFKQVNKEFCRCFNEYLKNNEELAQGTKSVYSGIFTGVINSAIRDEIIEKIRLERLPEVIK